MGHKQDCFFAKKALDALGEDVSADLLVYGAFEKKKIKLGMILS